MVIVLDKIQKVLTLFTLNEFGREKVVIILGESLSEICNQKIKQCQCGLQCVSLDSTHSFVESVVHSGPARDVSTET